MAKIKSNLDLIKLLIKFLILSFKKIDYYFLKYIIISFLTLEYFSNK